MSPLVRKEIRMLMPGWILAVAAQGLGILQLITSHYLGSVPADFYGVTGFLTVVAILTMVLAPFGKEASYGTFSLLLVQPAERVRIWRTKTLLLFLSLLSIWIIGALSWVYLLPESSDLKSGVPISGGLVLIAFSGGLWTTILLRDVVSSFFCTFLAPSIVAGMAIMAVSHWLTPDDKPFEYIIYTVLIVYSIAGFLWARWMFLRAEDVGWTGGQIAIKPWMAITLKSVAGRNRWLNLVKKELQLQEVALILLPLLLLMHLLLVALSHFNPNWFPNTLELVRYVTPFIWMAAMPLVIGCGAVSEERRLNTYESLLCLPVSKAATFTIKLMTTLLLGTVLGGVIPFALLRWAGWNPGGMNWTHILEISVLVPALATFLAFYASTMSKGLLQALPTLLASIIIPWASISLAVNWVDRNGFGNFEFMRSSLVPALAWPTALITVLWLSFSNYKQLLTGWSLWFSNLFKVTATFGCVAAIGAAIYDRDWELLERLEPPHKAAQISGEGRVKLGTWASRYSVAKRGNRYWPARTGIFALLPDGRLWVGTIERNKERPDDLIGNGPVKHISGHFVAGNDWTAAAGGRNREAYALRADGTLWRIDDTEIVNGIPKTNETSIVQVGSDTDWKAIIQRAPDIYRGIKRDGTLWVWHSGELEAKYPPTAPEKPHQIGAETNWESFLGLHSWNRAIAVRRDGTWETEGTGIFRGTISTAEWKLDGTNWVSIVESGGSVMAVQKDGSLWVAGNVPPRIFGNSFTPRFEHDPIRVGKKSDWVALDGDWRMAALESNGNLQVLQSGSGSKRPSRYSDWIAICQEFNWTWALAKDGTITCWDPFTVNDPEYGAGPESTTVFSQRFFLGPTRRPVASLNIFDKNL